MAPLSGRTGGIGWTRVEMLGRSVRIPHGGAQFVVLYEGDAWLVVRADTLERCPPSGAWHSSYEQLGPALREALDRQVAWTGLAIGMFGRTVAAEGGPPTRFELDARRFRGELPRRHELAVPFLPPAPLDQSEDTNPSDEEVSDTCDASSPPTPS